MAIVKKNGNISPKIFQLKEEGIARAKMGELNFYRNYSRMVGIIICDNYGRLTVDDIRQVFDYHGIPLIGSNWFTFLSDKNKWKSIGKVKSRRSVARGRLINLWEKI